MSDSTDLKDPPTALRLVLEAIVRHAISVACAALATHGVLTQGDHTTQVLLGSAGAIVMMGWSMLQKMQHSQYVLDLEATAKARVKRAIAGQGGASATAFLVAAVLAGGALVSSCAALKAPKDPQAVANQIAEKTNRVEHAIVPLQDIEIQAERAALALAQDVATRDKILKAHVAVQKDFKQLSADVRHAAEVATGLTSDPLPLGQLIQKITAEVQPLADAIAGQFGASPATRTSIGAAATVISAAIASIAST